MKKILIFTVIFIVLLIMFDYGFAHYHEKTHSSVCEKFNGNVTEFEVNFFWQNQSHINCKTIITPEYRLAQSNVEAVSQIKPLISLMIILSYLIVVGRWFE